MSPLKKITWVLLGSSFLVLVLLVLYLSNTLQGFAINQWVDSRSHSASQVSRLIDGELLRAQKRLQLLAQQDAFRSIPDPSLIDKKINGIPRELDSARRNIMDWVLAEKDQSFNVLFVLLPNGDHYLCHPYSVQQSLEIYNLSHHPYFKEASTTRQAVISNTFVGADGISAIAILVPVLDEDGQITSFLGGVFHLPNLAWLVENFCCGMDHGSLFLLDETGSLVVKSGDDPKALSGTLETPFVKGFIEKKTLDGPSHAHDIVVPSVGVDQKIVILSRLECGWTVGLESDLDGVSGQFEKTVWRTVGLMAALLLIVGIVTIFQALKIGLHWQTAHVELQSSHDRLEQDIEEGTRQLAIDAAAHRQTAAALLEREKLFDAIMNQSAEGITVADPEGRYTFVNPAFCEMIGYSQAELLQMTVFDVKAPSQDVSSFDQSKNSNEGIPFTVVLQRKDGSEFQSEIMGKMIEVGERKVVLGTIRDITDRLRHDEEKLILERQMLHAQKLESLGVLAGGIAHDFNNLLMAILGNADLALASLSPMSPARENLREIERASRRAAELSRQMLAYSGKGRFEVESIALGELVSEIAHLLEVSISKKVVLKYNFAENLPAFEGDVTQIRQIVLNLITNASEAIGDKSGIVSLTTGLMNCDRAYLDSAGTAMNSANDEPLEEGIYAYLEVADTGCGMDTETIEKVFDPFFTTKFTGRGLGMSAVQGIVRGHRGAIRVYSEVGKGTTIKILFRASDLPATETETVLKGSESSGQVSEPGFSGTVLIADDEETVCAVGKQMLERLGFHVLTAADGREAVDVFSRHANEITCVLLDLTMPHMDGEKTFGQLRLLQPDITVVLCSGYNEGDATQRFMGKGLAGFIQKPYTLALLREKLVEVLTQE